MQKIERMNQTRDRDKNNDYDITDILVVEKDDVGRLLLRLTIGGLMLVHGINKIFGGTEQVDRVLANVGLPVFFSFGVFIGEVIAPIMLILGFKVRLAAFFVAFNMFMATLLVHASDILKISSLGGWMVELNALYFFGSIAIMLLGSGRFALTKGQGILD